MKNKTKKTKKERAKIEKISILTYGKYTAIISDAKEVKITNLSSIEESILLPSKFIHEIGQILYSFETQDNNYC